MEIQSNQYSIYLGNDVLSEFNRILNDHQDKYSKVFIFCDENSSKYCLPYLIEQVPMLIGSELIEIESGEQNKTLDICCDVWKTIAESKADRDSLIINLGGGVVCDMGGFIASLYKRGLRFFHIPTTLLAQVDASVGGKLAIDFEGFKNQIGLFKNPDLVLVVPKFIQTLSHRQLLSGLAEVFKHALVADRTYWESLASLDFQNEFYMTKLLHKSISIKNQIVLEDWDEKGKRKILNFGHTIGHALESQALSKQQELLHGEAVAIGLLVESILSNKESSLSDTELQVIIHQLKLMFDLKLIDEEEIPELIEWMRHDKKNHSNEIQFSMLTKIGEAEFDKTCHTDHINQAILDYNKIIGES
jgi:3-dehydroquinate synthase